MTKKSTNKCFVHNQPFFLSPHNLAVLCILPCTLVLAFWGSFNNIYLLPIQKKKKSRFN